MRRGYAMGEVATYHLNYTLNLLCSVHAVQVQDELTSERASFGMQPGIQKPETVTKSGGFSLFLIIFTK